MSVTACKQNYLKKKKARKKSKKFRDEVKEGVTYKYGEFQTSFFITQENYVMYYCI
jgi:hypothetical protein